MRDAHEQRTRIIKDDHGVAYGVFLGANYCAEHEWGIGRLEDKLGRNSNPQNFNERIIAQPFTNFMVENQVMAEHDYRDGGSHKTQTPTVFLSTMSRNPEGSRRSAVRYDMNCGIAGAFSDGEFMIRGFDDESKQIVELLADGLAKGDFAFWMGGGGPFGGSGLTLVRASLVPQSIQDMIDADDEARRQLIAASQATGIHDKVSAKHYYALSPSMIEGTDLAKGRTTAHPVIYFLNPTEQQKNNYGWFTVEELEQWMEGKGPIPK